MSFLRVLTWVIPVASATRTLVPIGSRKACLAGGERDCATEHIVQLDVTTAPMSGANADALEGLLDGQSHVFPLETDLFAYSGLGPISFTATISALQSKHSLVSASITIARWVVDFMVAPSMWAVALWRWNGAVWVHYVVNSSGHKWINGVRNDATGTAWLTFDTALGIVQLDGAPDFFDGLSFLSFHPSDAFVAALFSFMGASELPAADALTYDGDVFLNASATVAMVASDVACISVPHNAVNEDGAWDRRARVLSFRLTQVPRT